MREYNIFIISLIVVGVGIGYLLNYLLNRKNSEGETSKNIFFTIIDKMLKLDYLKVLDVSISWLKGFGVRVEFYQKDKNNGRDK